jgi:hypothetical protein
MSSSIRKINRVIQRRNKKIISEKLAAQREQQEKDIRERLAREKREALQHQKEVDKTTSRSNLNPGSGMQSNSLPFITSVSSLANI